MKRARVAQIEWAKKPVKERAAIIRKASAYITKNCDELARTISDDNGKTRVDAVISELIPFCHGCPHIIQGKAKNSSKIAF